MNFTLHDINILQEGMVALITQKAKWRNSEFVRDKVKADKEIEEIKEMFARLSQMWADATNEM